MVQNFIQPKGSLKTQVDTSNLQSQLAQMFADKQLQAQAQAQAETVDPLRQSVNDLLKSKIMNSIDVPQYTTIKDVLNANKGDRLSTLADFLNNPQTMRTIGNFLPSYGYNPKTGKINNVMEEAAQEQEKLMQAKQAQAMQQLKEQNDLATSLNSIFNQRDIADQNDKRMRELAEQEQKWRTEEAEKDRAFRRAENAANRAQQMAISRMVHGGGGGSSSGGGSVTGGAANIGNTDLSKIKFTAADRKSLTENKTTLANIEAGLDSLEKNPNAYSFMKGVLGADITNRIDPEGVATRTQIDNITAVYRKWLTGAQMSDKERKAYERFLPAPTDNYKIVKSKLEGMKGAVQRSNEALLSNYGINGTDTSTTMPKVDNNALQAELKRRGLK